MSCSNSPGSEINTFSAQEAHNRDTYPRLHSLDTYTKNSVPSSSSSKIFALLAKGAQSLTRSQRLSAKEI